MKARTKQNKKRFCCTTFLPHHLAPSAGVKTSHFHFAPQTRIMSWARARGRRKEHSLHPPLRRGAPAPLPVAEVGGAAAGAAPRPYLRGRPVVPGRAGAAGGRAALGTLRAGAAAPRNSLRPATGSCSPASHPCAWSIRPLPLSSGRHTFYRKRYIDSYNSGSI